MSAHLIIILDMTTRFSVAACCKLVVEPDDSSVCREGNHSQQGEETRNHMVHDLRRKDQSREMPN